MALEWICMNKHICLTAYERFNWTSEGEMLFSPTRNETFGREVMKKRPVRINIKGSLSQKTRKIQIRSVA